MSTNSRIRRQRWVIFSVLALMYILVYFYRVSLAVVAGDISRELRLTPQQLGSLSGILFYVYAVAQLPLGPMIDRLGSRLVISGCGVLTTMGGLLFSQADSLAMAMAARVLIGIGTASVLMATFTIFSHWFSKQEFGRVSGFMVAIGNLGNLSATAPLALAVAAVGWRSSFLVIGLLQAVVTVLVFGMVRDRPPVADGGDAADAAKPAGMLGAWGEIFGNPHFWLLGLISFFWYGNYLALQGLWGGPYLMEVMHLSRAATGQMLMFTSLGFITGSMVIDIWLAGSSAPTRRPSWRGRWCSWCSCPVFWGRPRHSPCHSWRPVSLPGTGGLQRGDDLPHHPLHVLGADRGDGPHLHQLLRPHGGGGDSAGHGGDRRLPWARHSGSLSRGLPCRLSLSGGGAGRCHCGVSVCAGLFGEGVEGRGGGASTSSGGERFSGSEREKARHFSAGLGFIASVSPFSGSFRGGDASGQVLRQIVFGSSFLYNGALLLVTVCCSSVAQ